jgi:5,10-methylenetetrahydromethanopterin reductase
MTVDGELDISCAFATGPETPEHIVLAERLGYGRAWCYDSPALYPDVWMTLALAATRTERIGLGPAVLIPSLRHPMVNAAAIATLVQLAPGRVAATFGAGFTGRYTLGHRPLPWRDVAEYVRVVRALLRGDDAEWEGRTICMIHPDGYAPPRPIEVPILVGADGPRGTEVARELGDGVFAAGRPNTGVTGGWHALLALGTVLDEGETLESERVLAAAGQAGAVFLHGFYEVGGDVVDSVPGGREWREATEAVPASRRHLAVHEGHLVSPNERDLLALRAAASQLVGLTLTGSPAEVRDKVAALESQGVTEVAYQPAGPDIPRELETFAAAVMS